MKKITTLALWMSMALCAAAQKYDLKLNLATGQHYTQSMSLHMDMQESVAGQDVSISSLMLFEFAQEVISVTAEGNYVIENRYTHILTDVDAMGTKITYNSSRQDTSSSPLQAQMAKTMGYLVDKKFAITVSPKGKIVNISGLKEILDNMAIQNSDATSKQVMSSILDEKKMTAGFQSSYDIFPDKPVTAGESWKRKIKMESVVPVETEAVYTLNEVSNGHAKIAVSGELKMKDDNYEVSGMKMKINVKGNNKGSYTMDVKTGMCITASMTTPMKGTIEMMGMEVPLSISTTTDITTSSVK